MDHAIGTGRQLGALDPGHIHSGHDSVRRSKGFHFFCRRHADLIGAARPEDQHQQPPDRRARRAVPSTNAPRHGTTREVHVTNSLPFVSGTPGFVQPLLARFLFPRRLSRSTGQDAASRLPSRTLPGNHDYRHQPLGRHGTHTGRLGTQGGGPGIQAGGRGTHGGRQGLRGNSQSGIWMESQRPWPRPTSSVARTCCRAIARGALTAPAPGAASPGVTNRMNSRSPPPYRIHLAPHPPCVVLRSEAMRPPFSCRTDAFILCIQTPVYLNRVRV